MELIEKELVYSVVGAAFEVYNELGFGFREHVYQLALERELIARGHRVGREVNVRIYYKGLEVGLLLYFGPRGVDRLRLVASNDLNRRQGAPMALGANEGESDDVLAK